MYAQTDHLILRDPVPDDWHDIHIVLSDREVMRWIHLGPEPFREAQTREWIADLITYNAEKPRNSHNCVIQEIESQRVIGWIGIGRPSPGKLDLGDFDFGYALAGDCWGKGYTTEAVNALLNYAFNELGANTVFAECETHNIGSYRVMEKAGMQRTAIFHVAAEGDALPKEMFRYAISQDQWLTHSGK